MTLENDLVVISFATMAHLCYSMVLRAYIKQTKKEEMFHMSGMLSWSSSVH